MKEPVWKLINKKIISSNRIFDLVAQESLSPDNEHSSEFYILETKDWVNVIPITSDGQIVLVNQYRHGSQKMSLEIPGGIVETTSENRHLNAAKAELKEETGYGTDLWEYLGKVSGNPALFNNWCYFYIARNVEKLYETEFDPDEYLNTVLYPLEEIPNLIDKGLIYHPMVVSAMGMYWMKFNLGY